MMSSIIKFVKLVALLLLLSFAIGRCQYSEKYIRKTYPMYRMGKVLMKSHPFNQNNNPRYFRPNAWQRRIQPHKSWGFSNRQMQLPSNGQQIRKETNVKSSYLPRNAKPKTPMRNYYQSRTRNQGYPNRGYSQRHGNQFGFFTRPKNYGTYNYP